MNKPAIDPKKRLTIHLVMGTAAVPFLALFFYLLGGGKNANAQTSTEQRKGLNAFLPSPQLSNKTPDKLSLYKQDDKDSATLLKQRKRMNLFDDNQFNFDTDEPATEDQVDGAVAEPFSNKPTPHSTKIRSSRSKPPVDELETKLTALQRALKDSEETSDRALNNRTEAPAPDQQVFADLESAMAAVKQASVSGDGAASQELTHMSGMLDKILDIQHPERVRERLDEKQTLNAKKGLRVAPKTDALIIEPVLGSKNSTALPVRTKPNASDGFFDLSTGSADDPDLSPTIAAVVHDDQILVSGATIKVRIEQDIYIRDKLIPKGTFVFGNVSLSGERLQVAFTTVRYQQTIYPVSLTAYGLDGLPGIRIPGSMTRDAAKQGTNQAIQSIGLATMDPSLTAQATAVGLETAKSLLTKKFAWSRSPSNQITPFCSKTLTTANSRQLSILQKPINHESQHTFFLHTCYYIFKPHHCHTRQKPGSADHQRQPDHHHPPAHFHAAHHGDRLCSPHLCQRR
ncbi:conjugative transposon protein TraM [Chitinophaga sedimenti]|uniref:conjugative transposon protein TraM n=1 Tax=Chitinophaga sedimenti TaxID=2033606 RepID=UPI002006D613|nr:conjugative transposon protein TraM [Chitinophaga sedimenti]MCK7559425.1 conjugative transposon protein TraM [Chitinophaga sedimenti]